MNPLDALRRARGLWSRAWPLWSVRMAAIGAMLTALAAATPDTLLQIWHALPDDIRALFPDAIARLIPTVLFMLTIVVRLIPQRTADERLSLWKSTAGRVTPKTGGMAAAVVAAIMVDEQLGGLVELIEPGDRRNSTATLASTRRLAFTRDFDIQFTAQRNNPALGA